jgi:hypothetical protein
MKNKHIFFYAAAIGAIAFSTILYTAPVCQAAEPVVLVRANDSLRVGSVLREMNKFSLVLQDSITPVLDGDIKKDVKNRHADLKKLLKAASSQFKDTMLTDFNKLSDSEKTNLKEIEKAVAGIKDALPVKSQEYHRVALAYIPVYRAIQEMQSDDGRMPLVATYAQPYDPNTTTNNQVSLYGAYLNFYLEYRINVGGIELGPDIVDAERLVFTFPDKLLADIKEPTYVEVKAAPKKREASRKISDNPEQHIWLLVYPKK